MPKYSYVPELDYYFDQYWEKYGESYFQYVSQSIHNGIIPTLPDNSLIRLLFSKVYEYDHYIYTFNKFDITQLPTPVYERLLSVTTDIDVYISDEYCNSNIYDIQEIDLSFLDILLLYRQMVVTEHSITLIRDFLSRYEFDTIPTNLSKLIYIYLNLLLNNEHSILLDRPAILIEYNNNLEKLFEIYVLNESHIFIRNTNIPIKDKLVNIRPVRESFTITDEYLISNEFTSESPSYDNNIIVHLNGNLLIENTDYIIKHNIDTVKNVKLNYTIIWKDKIKTMKLRDIMSIDYYTMHNPSLKITSDLVMDDHVKSEWLYDYVI